VITAGELQGAMVRTERGKKLGRLREIHLRGGRAATLVCGGGAILQRFLPSRRGKRVAWAKVVSFGPHEIVVRD
jgi:sporulation protein YlmC with PRC-barrel domain